MADDDASSVVCDYCPLPGNVVHSHFTSLQATGGSFGCTGSHHFNLQNSTSTINVCTDENLLEHDQATTSRHGIRRGGYRQTEQWCFSLTEKYAFVQGTMEPEASNQTVHISLTTNNYYSVSHAENLAVGQNPEVRIYLPDQQVEWRKSWTLCN